MQTLHRHFTAMARYSAWANDRLTTDAKTLPDNAVDKDVGLYFKTLFLTLNHLLRSDMAWLHILQGGTLQTLNLPAAPTTLLEHAEQREQQDAKLISWVDELQESWFSLPFTFKSGMQSWRDKVYTGTNDSILTHVFNHQTHHRGQAHAALTILGMSEPRALDILVQGMLNE